MTHWEEEYVITGELKNKIDSLWEIFWTGGLTNKSIFDGKIQIGSREIEGSQLKRSVFHDFPAGQMYAVVQELVFPFIKNLHGDKESAYAKYMGDAIFKIPTPLMLDKIVTFMDSIYEQMAKLKATIQKSIDEAQTLFDSLMQEYFG